MSAGDVDNAVEHFRKAIDLNCESSKPGLPLALVTRGKQEDLAEALPLIEGYAVTNADHMYVKQALDTLRKAPPSQDPQLREHIQALLKKHKTP